MSAPNNNNNTIRILFHFQKLLDIQIEIFEVRDEQIAANVSEDIRICFQVQLSSRTDCSI